MIKDKETNIVYFSELLSTNDCFNGSLSRLKAILDKHQVRHNFIKSTKDIWCRDYMPIQKSQNEFIQFRYEPSYLKDETDLQSDPQQIHATNNIQAIFSKINLDGGNVLRWDDRVIITDRIFSENHEYPDSKKLIKELEELLDAEVMVIPQINSNLTGHADGLVRFYDRNTIIGNRLEYEYHYWQKRMKEVIANYGLNYVDLPIFQYRVKGYPHSAIGYYVNYLEVGNLIVMPIFEVEGNKDDEAVNILTEVFPDRIIETINVNDIAKEGGLLNCISWNIKTADDQNLVMRKKKVAEQ